MEHPKLTSTVVQELLIKRYEKFKFFSAISTAKKDKISITWLFFLVFPLISVVFLISACICQRPSWTPKTQPGGSTAATWLSFWISTRLSMSKRKWPAIRGCQFHKKSSPRNLWKRGSCVIKPMLIERGWEWGHEKPP